MNSAVSNAPSPNERQRLAVRARPANSPVMNQQWRALLFLHREYPLAAASATLPQGLQVDTFDEKGRITDDSAVVPPPRA